METPVAETVTNIEYLGEEQYTRFVEKRLEASYRHTAQYVLTGDLGSIAISGPTGDLESIAINSPTGDLGSFVISGPTVYLGSIAISGSTVILDRSQSVVPR